MVVVVVVVVVVQCPLAQVHQAIGMIDGLLSFACPLQCLRSGDEDENICLPILFCSNGRCGLSV